MASFGDLVVRLTLDKTRFNTGISGINSSLSTMGSLATAAAAGFTAIAAGAGAATYALVQFVKPSFDALDALGDLSKRLGVATDDLAALQFAAKLAGVEQEGLTVGVTKFLDTLSNANNGVKAAVSSFEALGISAQSLKGLDLTQQMVQVADAIGKIEDPADRVRIAMDLFGRSGTQMLQLFNDGGQSLVQTLEEARALGVAPTNEEVERIQRANDAIDKMKASWSGVANTLAIELAPSVEKFANMLTETVPKIVAEISIWSDAVTKVFDNLFAQAIAYQIMLDSISSGKIPDITAAFKAGYLAVGAARTMTTPPSELPTPVWDPPAPTPTPNKPGSGGRDPNTAPNKETAKNTSKTNKLLEDLIRNMNFGKVGVSGVGF